MSGKLYAVCGFWEDKGVCFLKHSEMLKMYVEFVQVC